MCYYVWFLQIWSQILKENKVDASFSYDKVSVKHKDCDNRVTYSV